MELFSKQLDAQVWGEEDQTNDKDLVLLSSLCALKAGRSPRENV